MLLAKAKTMHISMCINASLRKCPELKVGFLMLLDRITSICDRNAASSPVVKAVSQLLPGKLHGWPCSCCSTPLTGAGTLSKVPQSTHTGNAQL